MSTPYEDVSVFRGEDDELDFTMVPVTNIAGWTLALAVKEYYDDSAYLFTKSGSAVTITDAGNGLFVVTLSSADTLNLEPKAYVYNVVRTDNGTRTVLAWGNFLVKPSAY